MNQDMQDLQDMAQKLDDHAEKMDQDRGTIDAIALAAEGGDIGAPFEKDAIAALRDYKERDLPGYERFRLRLKKAGVRITDLEKELHHGDGAPAVDGDESVADKLIALARDRCKFVHDAQRQSFAIFASSGARQVYEVSSSGFSEYLSHAYYTEYDRAPSEASLKVALATLRGQAQFDGESCEVFTRVAKTSTGHWLDLCNDQWECVQITATGWAVVSGEAAPLFTRSSSMRPLPVPTSGGSLDELWPLVNIPESDRLLVLAWMLECLRPDTPYVVLELIGEQGSVKSTTQKFLRQLIDPNQADLRSAPKTVEDLWVAGRNSHMVSLENLSHLKPDYQDALCVLATGGGYAARTLFTNADETILDLRKPIVINGISVIVTAQDLLDRTLHIDLPTIHSRKLAGEVETQFERKQPMLLGALLDLFVKVLAELPSVVIAPQDRPRMADFAILGQAVYRVFRKQAGEFLNSYNTMRKAGVYRTIEGSPVGAALLAYLSDHTGGWHGKLSDLLPLLEKCPTRGDGSLPRSGKGMADAVRRLAPALRTIGYECYSDTKTGGSIKWHIFPKSQPVKPSPASPASPEESSKLGAEREISIDTAGHAGLAGHESGGQHHQKNMLASNARDVEEF